MRGFAVDRNGVRSAPLSLALVLWACAEPTALARIDRLEPDSVTRRDLPMAVLVRGSGLVGPALRLDSRRAPQLELPRARLGELPVEVRAAAGESLELMLPAALGEGSHDLELSWRGVRRAFLRQALEVRSAASAVGRAGSEPRDGGASRTGDDAPSPQTVVETDAGSDGDPSSPAVQIAAPVDFETPELVELPELSSGPLWSPALSDDGLELFFAYSAGSDAEAIWRATRATTASAFESPRRVPNLAVPSQRAVGTPFLSADNLTLHYYVASGAARDLAYARRADRDAPFEAQGSLAELSSSSFDHLPWASQDGLRILFSSLRGGRVALYESSRQAVTDPFGSPSQLRGFDPAEAPKRAYMTEDGLALYYVTDRSGGVGGDDLWLARRADPADEFDDFLNLSSVNSAGDDVDVTYCGGSRELWFVRTEPGAARLYRALVVR